MQKRTKTSINELTRTGLLARNTLYNLLGQVAPFVAILIALPILTQQLGAARFGVLGIAWVVLGYFGLFDFGLGRVITKMIAEKLASDSEEEINDVIWTGLGFMLLIGLAIMLLLLVLAPVFVTSLLKIPIELQPESRIAFSLLGLCVPFVILTSGLRAILEAYQRFGVINIIRTINGVLLYVAPLAVLPFTQAIHIVVLSIVIVRVVITVLYAIVCQRSVEHMQRPLLRRELFVPMFKLGGWMSVSNIIGPVMVYFDRFLLGIWISVAAVSYYVTPYELVSKLLFVTAAFVRVLFPAFSMSLQADAQHSAMLYSRSIRVLLLIFFPVTLFILFFAKPGMTLWLDADFAAKGAGVMQWLAIGIFANAPGQVAFAVIQAAGRPDITAKIHIIETPFYLLALYFFVQWFGILGAAMAWTGRLLFETFLLFWYAEKLLGKQWLDLKNYKILYTASLVLLLGLPIIGLTQYPVWLFLTVLSVSIVLFWLLLIEQNDKQLFAAAAARVRHKGSV
jgi:O-antigen/teichoic acid export membrane protein